MLLSKANLDLVELASTDETRWGLCGLHITPLATVATDGHVLGAVGTPTVDVNEFPANCGGEDTTVGEEGLAPVTIPIDAARTLAKSIPGKRARAGLPILAHAFVQVPATNADGMFHALTTDLETTRPLAVRKVEGEYPDFQQVYPRSKAKTVLHVNPVLLGKVCSLAAKMGAKMIRLELRGELDPIVLEGTAGDEADHAPILFLVMRMRGPKA